MRPLPSTRRWRFTQPIVRKAPPSWICSALLLTASATSETRPTSIIKSEMLAPSLGFNSWGCPTWLGI